MAGSRECSQEHTELLRILGEVEMLETKLRTGNDGAKKTDDRIQLLNEAVDTTFQDNASAEQRRLGQCLGRSTIFNMEQAVFYALRHRPGPNLRTILVSAARARPRAGGHRPAVAECVLCLLHTEVLPS